MDINKMSNDELIEIYKNVHDFIKYLEKSKKQN